MQVGDISSVCRLTGGPDNHLNLLQWVARTAVLPDTNERCAMKGNVAAIVLVLVGTFFLLSNLGVIQLSLAELFSTWWPAILIVVGLMLFFTPNGEKKPKQE
jgi:hypothetical protein